ncbi:MAG: hypothetical protein QOJ12_2428 [Thermoleophilales bacterium]|nr:hypothetical protein [Thermoleophilales bacterium]
MFEDLHLVPEDGRAVAVFSASAERRAALADALSWLVTRRFQTEDLDADHVLALRAAGALADRLDEFRGVEGLAPVRVTSDQVRLLIEASWAYIADRDVDSYQPPEERARIDELTGMGDRLFDLVAELDRADKILSAS